MTAYVTIPNSDVDPESPITTSLMVALRDNPTAITEKAVGAPVLATDYVVAGMIAALAVEEGDIALEAVITASINDLAVTEAKLAASSVSQSKIKSANGEFSTTSQTPPGLAINLPGGQYGFMPELKNSNSIQYGLWTDGADRGYGATSHPMEGLNTTYISTIYLLASASTASLRQTYISSSPPYNLGYGDIPIFIFLILDKITGEIIGTYVAPDAPWHNNGPTDISPDLFKNGKPYKIIRNNNDDIKNIDNPSKRKDLLGNIKKKKVVLIDQKYKNRDIDIIPHPFTGNDLLNRKIVLLDPLSSSVKDLIQLHDDNISVGEILHNGYIKINKTGLDVKSPKGVLTVKASWKKT